ncbi:hypothetical protein [Rhizobium rhizogenes]|uniref:hypothetical protein n=1 Tax=Rhizobium rhizogenes TaxID=359 RepID=UPI0015719554|nr:hypothetical protein [Rhizobium rhizogenes]NTH18466.1 hypothetical protein [Rhizobium rhizogenes]NTH31440.1 hypothetical protein [Rhizobium rhizogenes]
MKTVVSNDMVAHLWANKSQHYARSANGNLYFDGATIYSYGRHFPIAKFITNEAGEEAVLFTTDHYSVTTSAHVSRVWRALEYGAGRTMFLVPKPGDDLGLNTKRALEKIEALLDQASRARSRKPIILAGAEEIAVQINRWAEFLGQPRPFNVDDLVGTCVEAREAIRRQQEEDRRQREAARARMAAEAEEKAARWVAGETIDVWQLRNSSYIRIRAKGDTMETSWGAECPLKDAIAIFRLAAKCRTAGRGFVPSDSISAGSFSLRHIHDNGTIQVGCHCIEWPEAERLALELGVIEAPVQALSGIAVS